LAGRRTWGHQPTNDPGEPSRELPTREPSIVVVGSRSRKPRRDPEDDKKEGAQAAGVENRQHPRLPLVVRALLRIEGAEQTGYLTNLSLGGAFLATEKPLPAGTMIDLLVFLPWKLGEFEAEASVVWSSGKEGSETDPPGVGLRFSRLDSHAETSLRRYVEKFFRLVAQIEE
jgi:uncharacterized protein (TIGR02266 family)